MNTDTFDAESKVSGNQAKIPAQIRSKLGINDGDRLRWHLNDDWSVRVHAVHQQRGTFANFTGYEGAEPTDVTSEHDSWAVDKS